MMSNIILNQALNYSSTVFENRIDCSNIRLQMCNTLGSNINLAILIMGIGLLMQILRNPIAYIEFKLTNQTMIGDYLRTSYLPELFILVSFIFIAYSKFLMG